MSSLTLTHTQSHTAHTRVTRLNTRRKATRVRVNVKLVDTRLTSHPTVVLKPLSPKLIKKYDYKFYVKFKRKLLGKRYVHRTNEACVAHNTHTTHNTHTRKLSNVTKGWNEWSQSSHTRMHLRLWRNCNSHSLLCSRTLLSTLMNNNVNNDLSHSDVSVSQFDFDEPEVSQISDSEYFRYLNVIKKSELSRKSISFLRTSFPLRRVSRCDANTNTNTNTNALNANTLFNNVLCNYQPFRSKNDEKCGEVKKKKKRFLYDFQRKYRIMSERKREHRLLSKMSDMEREDYLRRQYLYTLLIKCASKFEFSSPLGSRITESVSSKLSELDVKRNTNAKQWYESSHCSTKIRFVSTSTHTSTQSRTVSPNSASNIGNKWNCKTMERLCFNSDITATDVSTYFHKYSFNRRQRLERCLRLLSGLDWRARLLVLNCVPLTVNALKCNRCPICGQSFTREHCCPTNQYQFLKWLKPVAVKLERMLQIKLDDPFDESLFR